MPEEELANSLTKISIFFRAGTFLKLSTAHHLRLKQQQQQYKRDLNA